MGIEFDYLFISKLILDRKAIKLLCLDFSNNPDSHLPFIYAMQIMRSSLLLHVESIVKVCIKHLSAVFFFFFFFLIIRNSFHFQFHSYVHLVCFCVTKLIYSFKKNAANKTNQYFTSIKLLFILLIIILPTFCESYGAAAQD